MPRFILRSDDLEGQSRLFMHTANELGAIGGLSTSLGRDAAHAAHAMLLQLLADVAQGINGPFNSGVRQAASLVQPLPQTCNLGMRIDHAKRLPPWLSDQQAAVICPKVDGRKKRCRLSVALGASLFAGTGRFFISHGVAQIDDLGHCYHRSGKWLVDQTSSRG